MLSNDLLIKIIDFGVNKKYFLKQSFVLALFSFIADDAYEDDMIVIKDKTFSLKNDDELIELTNKYTDKLLNINDKVDLPKNLLINNTKDITTTMGRVVMNYIILVHNFKHKIPYINERFTVGDIENKFIAPLLTDDENDLEKIAISEYKSFIASVTYIEGFSKVLSVAATYKSMMPPDGIEEFKKKVVKEMIDKYGPDWHNDPIHTAELEKKLKEFDDKWLEGDISNGKLMVKKTKLARKKMYLNVGMANAFNGKQAGVSNSLMEGWGTDEETLSTIFNDARSGSYYRGVETQDGGSSAKFTLRASSDIDIVDTDCGSNISMPRIISDDDIGRYIIINRKPLFLTHENINTYKNKEHTIRTTLYCKLEKDFCSKCVGDNLKDYERGVSLLSIDVSGNMLKHSLAKFHSTALELTEVTIDDIL